MSDESVSDTSSRAVDAPEILGFDHVQRTMPRGEAQRARAFYGATLGLAESLKPAALAGRGVFFFFCVD